MSSLVDRASRHNPDTSGYAPEHPDQGYNNFDQTDALPPPHLPFVSSGSEGGFGPGSRRDSSQSLAGSFVSKTSRDSKPSNRKSGVLSTHYVPTKMSGLHQPGQYAHRRPAKRGGGMNAWNAEGHGRMGGEDEDGDEGRRATGPVKDNTGRPKKLVWNRFKWTIFIANIVVSPTSSTLIEFPELMKCHYVSVFGILDCYHGRHTAGLVRHLRQLGCHASRKQDRAYPYVILLCCQIVGCVTFASQLS